MNPRSDELTPRRRELMEQLLTAGRESSTSAVMFHATVAELQGLSATEEKAIDVLERHGPLTARQLTERVGLAPATVSGLVDRLEAKGFARRVPNPDDGRSVLIETIKDRVDELGPVFANWMTTLYELCAKYSDKELRAIIDFLSEAAKRQQETTQGLVAINRSTERQGLRDTRR